MKREHAPADVEIKFLAKLVSTHGTEVAPGSDVVEKYFYSFHGLIVAEGVERAMRQIRLSAG